MADTLIYETVPGEGMTALPVPQGWNRDTSAYVKTEVNADGSVYVVTRAGETIVIGDGNGSITVDSTQLPAALAAGGGLKVEGVAGGVAIPVTGTVTAVTDITNAVKVTDNNGSLTVDSTQLPAALAAGGGMKVEGVAGGVAVPVSGPVTDTQLRASAVPVSLAALPALVAGSANIGDVDVASVVPGTGATNLGKASGTTTYAGGDVGVPALVLRSVNATAKANDGDYTVMQTDASGRLFTTATLEATDVNIGNVDIASALPAGTNLIGSVRAFLQSDYINVGTTGLAPKYKYVDVAASQTRSELIAAVAGKKIRPLAMVMVAGATATTSTFYSATTQISCAYANGANGGAVMGFNPVGWFETAAGEALNVTTGAGSSTGYQVVYIEV